MNNQLPAPISFREYLLSQDFSVRTVTEYSTAYQAVLRFCPNLSKEEIQRFYGGRAAHATRHFYFYFLRHLGKYLSRDLTDGITHIRPNRIRTPKHLEYKEIEALTQSKPLQFERKYKALFLLITATGLRLSEALSILAEDLATVMTVRGKGDQDRQVFLDPAAAAAITHLTYNKQSGKLFDFSRNSAYVGIKKWATRFGVELHPHQLRHTYATYLLNSGADIEFIRDTLGHSSLATTQRYISIDPARKMAIYLKLNPLGRIALPEASREPIKALDFDVSLARPRTVIHPLKRPPKPARPPCLPSPESF